MNFEISVDDYFSIISHVVIESLKRSCIDSFKGSCSSPFSVIMLVIKLGGVISNAGLNMCTPLGTILLPAIFVTSFESRSSITTSSIRLLESNDDRGVPRKREFYAPLRELQSGMCQLCCIHARFVKFYLRLL